MVDFFVLGAAKAGTTTLAALLSSHPQVYTGLLKEPQFFDLHYHQGLDYLQRQFSGRPSDSVCGDCSPQYLHCPWVPARIKKHFPQARLLVLVRDPVGRFYSNWWMKHANGTEKRSFEECVDFCLSQHQEFGDSSPLALADGEELWRQYFRSPDTREVYYLPYFEIGLYARHLKSLLLHFPKEQLKVLSFRTLVSEPEETYGQCCDFLGIASLPLEKETSENQALGPLAVKARRVAKWTGLNRLVPQSLQDRIRAGLRRVGDEPPTVPVKQAERLRAAYDDASREFERLMGMRPE